MYIMQFKIFLTGSVLGVLGLITRIHAVPIEVIYTGDSCDCPKKLNYLVNMPMQPEPIYYKPNEYGYNVERPPRPKASVTYSFDFMVEEPKKPTPPPEEKWDLFAKIDRITSHKKDCYAAEKVQKPCGCNNYGFDNRYVSYESSAAPRVTRNLKQPKSINEMVESPSPAAHIMAIFFTPLKQTNPGVAKSRNKRAISRIFMRPRTKEKRSDRLVKKYNKGLKDSSLGENEFYDDAEQPFRSRGAGIRPLQQLKRFLTLPNLRNKRDIKGEYDLIEQEREQMDLTLPEIIQYMPETLNPNFKKGQCNFGQRCQQPEQIESTTKTAATNMTNVTNVTPIPTKDKDSKNTTQNTLSANKANSLPDEEKEKEIDNSISPTLMKRNVGYYTNGGCPSVTKEQNPTPNPRFTYEALPAPLDSVTNDYGSDPVPQQYVGASNNPYTSPIIDNDLLLKVENEKSTIQHISNAQLDRIIAGIVNKHSDFIEAGSHSGGALVDPPQVQREEAKYFLKTLGPWNDLRRYRGRRHHYPKIHAHLRQYRRPGGVYVQSLPHYK